MSELTNWLRTQAASDVIDGMFDSAARHNEAAAEIDRLNELLSTITADASWCGYEGDVSVNVTLWDIPQCDGRGGLTLLQAAEKARDK